MQAYLSTPILRKISQKLSTLENRVSNLVVKADGFVRSNKLLGAMFGNETQDDVARLKPFLREDLIKSTVELCIACEKERAKRPSPATLRSWLDAQSLGEADEHRKAVLIKSVQEAKIGIKQSTSGDKIGFYGEYQNHDVEEK